MTSYERGRVVANFILKEQEQDLFKVDLTQYVLAHCISRDCAFGEGKKGHYGIAWTMLCNFPDIKQYCLSRQPYVGKAILYASHKGWVFNLVTKNLHYNKPTYETLRQSLIDMKNQIIQYRMTKIAMPRIASDLDRLNWELVKEMIVSVFSDTDLEILVCIKNMPRKHL